MYTFEDSGYLIEVGSNADENTLLVSTRPKSSLWFHLKTGTSPHGILTCLEERSSDSCPEEVIQKAARAVKRHSKHRNGVNVPVEYTRLANVQITGVSGLVTVTGKTRRICV